jgi:hypothetical protein
MCSSIAQAARREVQYGQQCVHVVPAQVAAAYAELQHGLHAAGLSAAGRVYPIYIYIYMYTHTHIYIYIYIYIYTYIYMKTKKKIL